MDFDKTYKAIVEFGTTTTTQDYTGEIISQKVDFNEDKIKRRFFHSLVNMNRYLPCILLLKLTEKDYIK